MTAEYYRKLFHESWYIVWPFSIGGMVLSVVCSLIAYPVTSSLLTSAATNEENGVQLLETSMSPGICFMRARHL
ncbi:MAG: hypothetical protein H0U60_11405 [Blastocatellia bacterium]|nr:hypothetical protein [Blastocatellia bacterium]